MTLLVGENAFNSVNVGIDSPGASTATITIKYGDTTAYTETKQISGDSVNYIQIEYNQFCIGNGMYTFEVASDKSSATQTLQVTKWVNSVHVRAIDSGNEIRVDLNLLASNYPGSGSFDYVDAVSGNGTWSISEPDGTTKSGTWSISEGIQTTLHLAKDFMTKTGTYTVHVSFTNDCAKSNTAEEDAKSENILVKT
jgi:hypothetical protein